MSKQAHRLVKHVHGFVKTVSWTCQHMHMDLSAQAHGGIYVFSPMENIAKKSHETSPQFWNLKGPFCRIFPYLRPRCNFPKYLFLSSIIITWLSLSILARRLKACQWMSYSYSQKKISSPSLALANSLGVVTKQCLMIDSICSATQEHQDYESKSRKCSIIFESCWDSKLY